MIKTIFKVYFWFLCLLLLVFIYFEFKDEVPYDFLDFIDWFFTLISLTGLYAYCYSKPFLTALFWKVFLPVLITWDICYALNIFSDEPGLLSGDHNFDLLVMIAFVYFILLVPKYFGLYLLPKEFER